MTVKVAQSYLTLYDPMDCSLPGPSVLARDNSSGKNTRMGCHSFLQGIFLTQESNPGLPHCRQIIYNLSHWRHPPNNASQNVNPQTVNLNSTSDSEYISRRKIRHPCSTSLQLEETYSLISRLSVQSPLSNFLDETCIFPIFVFMSQQKCVSFSSWISKTTLPKFFIVPNPAPTPTYCPTNESFHRSHYKLQLHN